MTMNLTKITLAALAASFSFAVAASAQDAAPAAALLPPASTKTGVTYTTDLKPIFDANCVKCHSGEKPKAHLHMDTLEGILKGTKHGPIFTSGDGANSLLVKAVAHQLKDTDGEDFDAGGNRAGHRLDQSGRKIIFYGDQPASSERMSPVFIFPTARAVRASAPLISFVRAAGILFHRPGFAAG
jgi:hypothetical protein